MEHNHKITPFRRWWRLTFARRTPGTCVVCGCTETDPCFTPGIGFCWWADERETVCSHCYHKDIFNNPDTVHCVNTSREQ